MLATGLLVAAGTLLWLGRGAQQRYDGLFIPALFLFGVAPALTSPAGSALPLAVLPQRVRGVAASLTVVSRQLTGVIGLTLQSSLLAIVEWSTRNRLMSKASPEFTEEQQQSLHSLLFDHDRSPLLITVPPPLHSQIITTADEPFVSGFRAVLFATAALVLLTSTLVAVATRRRRRPNTDLGGTVLDAVFGPNTYTAIDELRTPLLVRIRV